MEDETLKCEVPNCNNEAAHEVNEMILLCEQCKKESDEEGKIYKENEL